MTLGLLLILCLFWGFCPMPPLAKTILGIVIIIIVAIFLLGILGMNFNFNQRIF